jgi:hypothetical protein
MDDDEAQGKCHPTFQSRPLPPRQPTTCPRTEARHAPSRTPSSHSRTSTCAPNTATGPNSPDRRNSNIGLAATSPFPKIPVGHVDRKTKGRKMQPKPPAQSARRTPDSLSDAINASQRQLHRSRLLRRTAMYITCAAPIPGDVMQHH